MLFQFAGGDSYKFDGATYVKIHKGLFVRDIFIKNMEKEKTLNLPAPDCLIDVPEKNEDKDAAQLQAS